MGMLMENCSPWSYSPEEDVDGEGNLLLGVCREIKDKDGHEGVGDQWDDQVHCVEQKLPL